jgi:hypothetical protein
MEDQCASISTTEFLSMRPQCHQQEVAKKGWALSAAEAMVLRGRPDVTVVDLREKREREKHVVISGLAACALVATR